MGVCSGRDWKGLPEAQGPTCDSTQEFSREQKETHVVCFS